jgi:predicted transposase/invertase (TIGR01784 family)
MERRGMAKENKGDVRSQARPRLTSGFVFKSVFGEEADLTRELIELSLERGISSVEIVQGEREFDVLPSSRAGRVDVYATDSEGNDFDVEVQAESGGNELLRARHYQSLMDATRLRKGEDVEKLRDSVVVFVCDFDPLGGGLSRYDLRTVCLQTGEPAADGRRIVMLNARGPLDDVPAPLAAFLRLVAGQEVEGDPFCDRVNAIIDRKVADPKWMEDYMTFEDELEAARRNAEKRGIAIGEERKAAELALKLVRSGAMTPEVAADFAEVDLAELEHELARADDELLD